MAEPNDGLGTIVFAIAAAAAVAAAAVVRVVGNAFLAFALANHVRAGGLVHHARLRRRRRKGSCCGATGSHGSGLGFLVDQAVHNVVVP